MDITDIDKKIKFNPQRIYRLIVREVGQNINGLSEPCYVVHTQNFEKIIYRELGVTKKEWKDFANKSQDELGPKGKGNTYRVPFTTAIAYLYHRFAKANKPKMAETVLMYLLIKYYGSVHAKFFPKWCDPDVFRYTIDNLTKVHLFYREKTIANALIFLSKGINKKFFNRVKNNPDWNPELMHNLMHDGRQRINQSTKSFANAYMSNSSAGKGVSAKQDPTDDDKRNMMQTTTGADGKAAAIEKFLKSMFVYKNHDRKAVDEAKKISRVKNNLAEMVIPLIHGRPSEENVKIILTSFMKNILDTNSLCGPNFNKIVKKLIGVRNYKDTFVFRNLIVSFTNSLLDLLKPNTDHITTRDINSLSLFIALYLTISFRNLFC
jgi:hypothetical protein